MAAHTSVEVQPSPSGGGRGVWRWLRWVLLTLLVLVVLLVAAVVGVLWFSGIPASSAGLTAQTVCAGTFVSGRDPQEVYTDDVLPQSPALSLVSIDVDQTQHAVTAKFLGVVEREATLQTDRGCVLDLPPDPGAEAYQPAPSSNQPWPQGDAALPPRQWPDGVDRAGLAATADAVFQGAGDPTAANARAFAVVHGGRLLVERQSQGFTAETPLLGWSMTKTVNAMLAYKKLDDAGIALDTLVVDAFPEGAEPPWVATWRQDSRADMTITDLMTMTSGLDFGDDYGPFAKVVKMLYSEPSMADYAASQPQAHEPGTFWEYSTGVSDIISQVVQAQFPDDRSYWSYPTRELFFPSGVSSATMATDTSGTWVGGSYLYADTGDWARLGLMMMSDGVADGNRVLPAGWWKLAGRPAMPDGAGAGYGRQTWIPGSPVGGECKGKGVPPDTLSMEGHYGQVVAMIPSRDAVVVRLGWTIDKTKFDSCALIRDVVRSLPKN